MPENLSIHILEYEKQGFCAYIPLFGGGIEDFVIIVPEVLLRGTQARKSAFCPDFVLLKVHDRVVVRLNVPQVPKNRAFVFLKTP